MVCALPAAEGVGCGVVVGLVTKGSISVQRASRGQSACGPRAVTATLDPLRARRHCQTRDSLDDFGVAQIGKRASSQVTSVCGQAGLGLSACSDGDGDLAPDLAGIELAQGFRHLVQWIRSVDARRHVTGVDEPGKPLEVAGPLLVDEVRESLLGDN